MPIDPMEYTFRVIFKVKLKKWRIDDQHDPKNVEWSLNVYDRNLKQWVNINNLDRPNEMGELEEIQILEE